MTTIEILALIQTIFYIIIIVLLTPIAYYRLKILNSDRKIRKIEKRLQRFIENDSD